MVAVSRSARPFMGCCNIARLNHEFRSAVTPTLPTLPVGGTPSSASIFGLHSRSLHIGRARPAYLDNPACDNICFGRRNWVEGVWIDVHFEGLNVSWLLHFIAD